MLHSVAISLACWPLTSHIPAAQTGIYALDLRHCAACGIGSARCSGCSSSQKCSWCSRLACRLWCLLDAQLLPPCCEAKPVHKMRSGIYSTHKTLNCTQSRRCNLYSVSGRYACLSWPSSLASLHLHCCTSPVVDLCRTIIDVGHTDTDSVTGCCVSYQLCEVCPPCDRQPAASAQGLSPLPAALPPRPRAAHVLPGPWQMAASSGQTCRRSFVTWFLHMWELRKPAPAHLLAPAYGRHVQCTMHTGHKLYAGIQPGLLLALRRVQTGLRTPVNCAGSTRNQATGKL